MLQCMLCRVYASTQWMWSLLQKPSSESLHSSRKQPLRDSPGPSDPAGSRAQLEGVDGRAQARAGGLPARVRRGAAGQVQLPGRRARRGHHVQAIGQPELIPATAQHNSTLKVFLITSRSTPASGQALPVLSRQLLPQTTLTSCLDKDGLAHVLHHKGLHLYVIYAGVQDELEAQQTALRCSVSLQTMSHGQRLSMVRGAS